MDDKELYPGVSRRSLAVKLRLAEATLHSIANCRPQEYIEYDDGLPSLCLGCETLIEEAEKSIKRIEQVRPDL